MPAKHAFSTCIDNMCLYKGSLKHQPQALDSIASDRTACVHRGIGLHVCLSMRLCIIPGRPPAVLLEIFAISGMGAATKSPAGASRPTQSQKMNSLKTRSQMGTLAWSLYCPQKALPLLNHLLLCPLVRLSLASVVSCLCLACGHLFRACLPCVFSLLGLFPGYRDKLQLEGGRVGARPTLGLCFGLFVGWHTA